jgi:hypothetical protein
MVRNSDAFILTADSKENCTRICRRLSRKDFANPEAHYPDCPALRAKKGNAQDGDEG